MNNKDSLGEQKNNLSLKRKRKNFICDVCGKETNILVATYKNNVKRNGLYRCCKPQNTKEFWDNSERKRKHSESMKNSQAYYDSLKTRDMSGPKNPMYGKKISKETKIKMSNSRKGKFGKNATAWKGGKQTLLRCLKSRLNKEFNWFKKVQERDKYKCQHCNSSEKLDSHHIKPINLIVSELCKHYKKPKDHSSLNWLLEQQEIVDLNLENGITLCRSCHKKIHKNWGSHETR